MFAPLSREQDWRAAAARTLPLAAGPLRCSGAATGTGHRIHGTREATGLLSATAFHAVRMRSADCSTLQDPLRVMQ